MSDKSFDKMMASISAFNTHVPEDVLKLIKEYDELLNNRGELLRLGKGVNELAGLEVKRNTEISTKLLIASQILLDVAKMYAEEGDEMFGRLEDAL